MSVDESSSDSSSEASHDPGKFGFEVTPVGIQHHDDDDQVIPKNVPYTFSTKLNTLFARRKACCPFGILTSGTPPPNSSIRIHVFSADKTPVMRCQAHSEVTEREADSIAPLHFMRSRNENALYGCCPKSGELWVMVPYVKQSTYGVIGEPGPSSPSAVEVLTFLCSSRYCIKKELFVKFSLMNNEDILGHHMFALHVCSTPGRDRANHEDKKKKKRKKPSDHSSCRRPEAGPHIFKLTVKGRHKFDLLSQVNRGLELLEAVPPHIQQKYLKRYYASQASQTATSSSSASSATLTSSAEPRAGTSSDTRWCLRRILVRS